MTEHINLTSQAWLATLASLMGVGQSSKPRGMETRELLAHKTMVSMNDPVVLVKGRKLGYRFMCAEAAWILAGDNRVSSIREYSPIIEKFSDDGVYYFGAYGPKIVDQLSYVIQCLLRDRDSRQAVINIWREKPGDTRDVPCTISLQFIIRNGVLHCIDTMRSSDAWLGWPYDIFNMSMIARAIQIALRNNKVDVRLGNVHLTAGSQHIYEQHFTKAEALLEEQYELGPCIGILPADDFETIDDLVHYLWFLANSKDPLSLIYNTKERLS